MKKKSLLMFFLCMFFLLPNVVGAISSLPNDPEGILLKNRYGSTYKPYAGTELSVNLFNENRIGNNRLENLEFEAFKQRLLDNNHPYGQNLEKDKVWRANSGDVSVFMYRNNDGTLIHLGYATRKGDFYTANSNKTQIVNDTDLARKALNLIDETEGRPQNTSIEKISEFGNAERDKPLLQEKVNSAQKIVDDAKKKLENLIASDASAEEIKKAEQELLIARENLLSEENKLNIANQALGEKSALVGALNQNQNSLSCGITDIGKADCWMLWISYITNLVFNITGWTAYVVGTLFDYSLELSINSAEFFKKLGVVELTWSFIRDILNMTFIFILLYTAINILIGNDSKYNAGKILTNVIVFAILMNFSLFAAKLMVDGSNVVSLKIYEAMKVSSATGESSISLRVMDTLGVQKIYKFENIFGFNTDNTGVTGVCENNPSALITMHLLGTVILIVISLALGLAAVLFLIRLVNIIFLFIRSPLWVWGYTIPGNSSMNAISSKWWQEMKHVLFFPILYLFQMLIALIVFAKLGDAQKGELSLLDLICNAPGEAGIASSISLIAIFFIVIMFLMKAISYGVKHVGDGGEGAFGNKMGANMANKFAGWQTKMTTGLAKKAGMASVGVANRGLKLSKDITLGTVKRTSGALLGGIAGAFNRDGVWEGVQQGAVNPGIYTKEQLAKVTGRAANFTDKYMLGIGSKKLADATNSMTKNAEKERKDVYERRTKKSKEKEESLQRSAAVTYKPYTQKEWEQKNGEIGTDAGKAAKYEKYIKEMLEKQADVRLGKKIMQVNNRDHKKHIDALMEKAVKRETNKDGTFKVNLNNNEVSSYLKEITKYHTEGDGSEKNPLTRKGFKILFRTKRAEAQLKALEKSFDEEISNEIKEKAVKDYEGSIKKLQEKLSIIPDENLIDEMIKDVTKPGLDAKAGKEAREFNVARKKLEDAEYSYSGNIPPDIRSELEEKVYEAGEKIKSMREKIIKEVNKQIKEDIKNKEAKEKKDKDK